LNKSSREKSGFRAAPVTNTLGLQVETIYKKARLRELPSVKVGRALRFEVVAL
jgi:hypothetical protein